MDSLEQLNAFAGTGVEYQDQRDYTITFSPTTAVNQSVAIIESDQFVSPVGTNITEMFSTPGAMFYTIDLSSVPLPVLFTWPSTPVGVSASIISNKVYRMSGAINESTWDAIKNPLIQIYDQGSNFSYTASISYLNPANTAERIEKSWTVSVTVTNSLEITTPGSYIYIRNFAGVIDNEPQIVDTTPDATYSLTVTPSSTLFVSTMSSAGVLGGTSSFNGISKVLTLTGSKLAINSHLSSITFTPATNQLGTFTLDYTLISNVSGLSTTVTQPMIGNANGYRIDTGTFLEDTPFNLGASIIDGSATASSFTFGIAQSVPSTFVNPGYFTVNGSNVGTSWNITSTKNTINAANVVYTPPLDYQADLVFLVSLSKIDNGNAVVMSTNDPVTIYNAGTNPEISNMVARTYLSYQTNSIFSSQTPVINDGTDIGQTYTITLASTVGNFGNTFESAIASNTYSFTGNMSAVNSQFSNMLFVPLPGPAQNGTFTYTQQRGNVNQVNTTLTMTGQTGGAITPQTTTITTSSTYTFNSTVAYYGTITILSVAGGGAGTSTIAGGGGQARLINASRGTADAIQPGTYNVTIGTGGSNVVSANITGNDSYMILQSTATKLAWSQGGNPLGGTGISTPGYSFATSDIPGDGEAGVKYTSGDSYLGILHAGAGGTGRNQDDTAWAQGGNANPSGTPWITGAGGGGLISNITGANIQYGAGAAGGYTLTAGDPAVSVATSNGGGWGTTLPISNRGGGGTSRRQRTGAGGTNSNPQAGAAGVIIIKIS